MKNRVLVLSLVLCSLLYGCVNLPNLIPGGGGASMTVIPVNHPFNINSYYGFSIFVDYQGTTQAQIRFLEGVFTMTGLGPESILVNPLSSTVLGGNSSLTARFLNANELVGRVDNALWAEYAIVINSCLGWQNVECTPDMQDICDGPLGIQNGACTFFDKYIPLKFQFSDGIHYGWLKISKDPLGIVYPEKSMIHEVAFSNVVGRQVRMGDY